MKEDTTFIKTVWEYYDLHGRDLPWRHAQPDRSFNVYHILVSEMMLQQTQVSRVVPKYQAFLQLFPQVKDLAMASLSEVLQAWQGLGYNRRAQYLHQAAQALSQIDQPWDITQLVSQKGIGPNTAAAVCVYSYNQPLVFIETNIRSVYLHHYFKQEHTVADQQLMPVIERTLDTKNAREWYWALMDYGGYLKTTVKNPNTRSKHYTRQSTFEGSRRQLRGAVLRALIKADKPVEYRVLEILLADERLPEVLTALQAEKLIIQRQQTYQIQNDTIELQ